MTSLRLPLEISEYIVDFLHSDEEALGQCCLVSKSWVPCARKHIFCEVGFEYSSHLEAWKEAFPDPANSPGYYTRSLYVRCLKDVTPADAERGGWIRAFSNVVQLELFIFPAAFLSQILALACSLPLLKDLCLHGGGRVVRGDDDGIIFQPSASPPFTGCLKLISTGAVEHVAHRLLGLTNGIRLRELKCKLFSEEDVCRMMALVEACPDTLEYIDIDDETDRNSWKTSIDFSNATKLKGVMFHTNDLFVSWVTMALKTIPTDHRGLQEVIIDASIPPVPIDELISNLRQTGKESYRHWMDLDHVLVQLMESRAVHVNVTYYSDVTEEGSDHVLELLPGTTKRGGTEEYFYWW